MFLWFLAESSDIPAMISINFYGWFELPKVNIRKTSGNRIISLKTANSALIPQDQKLYWTAWCTKCRIFVSANYKYDFSSFSFLFSCKNFLMKDSRPRKGRGLCWQEPGKGEGDYLRGTSKRLPCCQKDSKEIKTSSLTSNPPPPHPPLSARSLNQFVDFVWISEKLENLFPNRIFFLNSG